MTASNLQNLRILVTRPKTTAQGLINALQQQQALPESFSAIAIQPLALNNAATLAKQEKLIFTSANAVQCAASYLNTIAANTPLFAIGPSTARALQDCHLTVQSLPESFNSEGLLELTALQSVNQQKVGIVCGKNPRQLLPQTLKGRGAKVTDYLVYERTCPKVDSARLQHIKQQPWDVIITSSLDGLINLLTLFRDDLAWLQAQQLLVISPRMREAGACAQFKPPILCADGASDDAILNCLSQWQ